MPQLAIVSTFECPGTLVTGVVFAIGLCDPPQQNVNQVADVIWQHLRLFVCQQRLDERYCASSAPFSLRMRVEDHLSHVLPKGGIAAVPSQVDSAI